MSDQKRGKSHQRELSPLSRRRQPTHCVHWSIPLSLKFLPCRLAATGANTLPRPSRYSLTMVTGSKRPRADSDLLLCHVRLWRTSRLSFWQKFGCEHSEIRFILIVPSAHSPYPRPLTLSRRRRPRLLRKSVNSRTFSGRADNACTNLLGFFVRYVRTRGMIKAAESSKTADFYIASLPHTLATHCFLRLTRARGRRFLRGGMNQCTQCVGWRRRDRGRKSS